MMRHVCAGVHLRGMSIRKNPTAGGHMDCVFLRFGSFGKRLTALSAVPLASL